MISSFGARPTAALSASRPPSPLVARAQGAASAAPEAAKEPGAWRAPDEGVLCVPRRSFALHTWPDLSQLDPPDLLRFEPDAFAAPDGDSLASRAVVVLPAQPFASFIHLGEAAAAVAAVPTAPVRRALLSEPVQPAQPAQPPEPAPEHLSRPTRLPLAARRARRPAMPAAAAAAAAAAEAASRTAAGPDTSRHPLTLADALIPRSLKRPRPAPDPGPVADFDWASASESERASAFFAIACRIATRADLQVGNDLLPSGLSPVAFTTRFAQFHMAATQLPLEEMGRLMFVFVSRWHDRLAEPWSAGQWWALNNEALRRDDAVAPRVHACFVATYLFARGSQAQDRPAGGERVRQELIAALRLTKAVRKSDVMATDLHRSMALAVARLGQEVAMDPAFRLRAALLRSFTGCSGAQWVADGQARNARPASRSSAQELGEQIRVDAPSQPAK